MNLLLRLQLSDMIHIAILKKEYLDRVLKGEKTMECRLTRTRSAPFGRIAIGDTILLKQSGGPVRGFAVAGEVITREHLTPMKIRSIQRDYNDRILGEQEYWSSRKDCRYAVFIGLTGIKPLLPLYLKTSGRQAWILCNWDKLNGLIAGGSASKRTNGRFAEERQPHNKHHQRSGSIQS